MFSGNVAPFEPTPRSGCCADPREHPRLPLSAWGEVAAPNSASGGSDDNVGVWIAGSFDRTALLDSPAVPPVARP